MSADFTDDDALVGALRAGDEAAFAWLVDRYSASLRRLARNFVSTDATADEVVQETWLAVITGIARFEQRASVKTWVHRILVNVARTKGVREHRSTPFSSFGSDADGVEPAVDPDRFQRSGAALGAWAAPPSPWDEVPDGRLLAGETLAVVQQAVGALPPGQRAVIQMRDLDGFDAPEVCNALGLSETNQRVLLHRARAKVRQALEVHFEESDR